MELKRSVSIADIESTHPHLVDESHFKASHENWLKVRNEWLAFVAFYQNGDTIWEYEEVRVELGFASGSGGFLIKRGDTIIERFATYAVG